MPPKEEAVSHRVTVTVRVRPLNRRETSLGGKKCIKAYGGASHETRTALKIFPPGQPEAKGHQFAFDHVFPSTVGQARIFDDIGRPVLSHALQGFNSCIFAYGQTGSGKSYTMMGPANAASALQQDAEEPEEEQAEAAAEPTASETPAPAADEDHTDPNAALDGEEHRTMSTTSVSEHSGIIPRLVVALFQEIATQMAINKKEHEEYQTGGKVGSTPPEISYSVSLTFIEIYQEKVRCLLGTKKENLKVRQHASEGAFVEGVTRNKCGSAMEVAHELDRGNGHRMVRATNMNDNSSRSHAIVTLRVVQQRTQAATDVEEDAAVSERVSQVNLVDLAGSERAKSTGAEGDALREGANINKSLTVLGKVISALADSAKDPRKRTVVPYRESTLTWLLKENLGGNSVTYMLSTLSPAAVNFDETLSTLRYADRAKSIVTTAYVNEDVKDKKIRELNEEVAALRSLLAQRNAKLEHVPRDPKEGGNRPRAGIAEPGEAVKCEARLRLETATSLIQQIEDDSPGASPARPARAAATPASTAKKADDTPFLLNVHGAGDWVIDHLSTRFTALCGSCNALGEDDELEEENAAEDALEELSDGQTDGVRRVGVDPGALEGVWAPHAIFVVEDGEDGKPGVTLHPIGALHGCDTFLDDSADPVEDPVRLSHGTMVHFSDVVTLKFHDPRTAPPPPPVAARIGSTVRPTKRPSGLSTSSELSPSALTTSVNGRGPMVVPRLGASGSGSGGEALGLSGLSGSGKGVPRLAIPGGGAASTGGRPASARVGRAPAIGGASIRGNITPRVASTGRSKVAGATDELAPAMAHTFVIMGGQGVGKTSLRSVLGKDLSFFESFASRKAPAPAPTAGFEVTRMPKVGSSGQAAELVFLDLAGSPSFAPLLWLAPERRVTFLLCARLGIADLRYFKPFLEAIQGAAPTEASTVIVVGTCRDEYVVRGRLANDADCAAAMLRMTDDVSSLWKALEPVKEMRPRIAGTLAVSAKDRTVVARMSGLSGPPAPPSGSLTARLAGSTLSRADSEDARGVKTMSGLLTLLADHAIAKCVADAEFPRGAVPARLLSLMGAAAQRRQRGHFLLTAAEYKQMANEVDGRYHDRAVDELHRHTQLLHSWLSVHHRHRHALLKRCVFVDPQWVFAVVTVWCFALACAHHGVFTGTGEFVDASHFVSSYGSVVPYSIADVQRVDAAGCAGGTGGDDQPRMDLTAGVISSAVAIELFRRTLRARNYTIRETSVVMDLLEKFDLAFPATRVISIAPTDDPGEPAVLHTLQQLAQPQAPDDPQSPLGKLEDGPLPGAVSDEVFYVSPAFYQRNAPVPVHLFLPLVLNTSGQLVKFTLTVVPPLFFARLMARLSLHSRGVYFGPLATCDPNEPLRLWCDVAWLIAGDTSRVLLHFHGHSLFVHFHDHDEDDGTDRSLGEGAAAMQAAAAAGEPIAEPSLMPEQSDASVTEGLQLRAVASRIRRSTLQRGVRQAIRDLASEAPGIHLHEFERWAHGWVEIVPQAQVDVAVARPVSIFTPRTGSGGAGSADAPKVIGREASPYVRQFSPAGLPDEEADEAETISGYYGLDGAALMDRLESHSLLGHGQRLRLEAATEGIAEARSELAKLDTAWQEETAARQAGSEDCITEEDYLAERRAVLLQEVGGLDALIDALAAPR